MENNIERKKGTKVGKLRQFTLLIALMVLFVTFAIMSEAFLSNTNLLNVMRQISTNTICAVGMTMIIILGYIDLSVGSALAFLSVIGALVFNSLATVIEGPILAAITLIIVVGTGVGIGTLSGFVTAKGKVPAFVTTLALMQILRGLGYIITDGSPIPISNAAFKVYGSGWVGDFIPVPVVIMIIVILSGIFITQFTRFGRYIYAIGGNQQASQWSGLKTDKIVILVFALSGGLYGMASMIMAGRLGGGFPAAGTGAEMDAIAAAILGGSSLAGGKGTIVGTLIGAVMIGFINNGLTLLDVSTYWQQVLMGVIILVAVLLDIKSKAKR